MFYVSPYKLRYEYKWGQLLYMLVTQHIRKYFNVLF